MPPEVEMELPVWPLTGRTWPPHAETPIPNVVRALRAVPLVIRCAATAPRLTLRALKPSEYAYQASSLSSLYRLSILASQPGIYDVLHAQFGTIGNTFRFARSLWKAPLVVSFRGHDYSRWPREHGRDVYRRLFDVVDAVTVNTDFSRGRVEALGCPPGKIHKLPTGVNPDDVAFLERCIRPGESVRLLTVARLVEMKGVEYALRAVARVRETHPTIRYDIIGDGPLRPSLERLARELGLVEAVTFHGARDTDAVRRTMASAHIFVLTSVTTATGEEEGLGTVLIEAQASGLPVLVTEHNGFPEAILPDRSGLLVPERDVHTLAARLTFLVEHPEEWASMGRAGRVHVEQNFDSRKLIQRLVGLYEETIHQFRRDIRDRRNYASMARA